MGDSSESIHDPVLAADQSPAPAPEDQQTMHVHKIKPVHGWKEFLNEILIIVIGVLIALGLEQVVEEVHWQNKVADAEQRLKTEETANFGFAAEQVIVTPCILAQLNRIRDHVISGEAKPLPTDNFPNNLAVLRLPTRPWAKGTWEALQQDGTAAHFSIERQRYLGALYHLVESMVDAVGQSGNASGRLLATSYEGSVTSDMRGTILLTLAEQYRRSQYMSRIALQLMGSARDIHLAPSVTQADDFLGRMTFASNTIGFCRDRGLPLANWRAELKKIPSLDKRPY